MHQRCKSAHQISSSIAKYHWLAAFCHLKQTLTAAETSPKLTIFSGTMKHAYFLSNLDSQATVVYPIRKVFGIK
jgi:hypothetical protein